MATIKIEPIKTVTKGGYSAEITGINPGDVDCIIGTVLVPHGNTEKHWNESGICRDNPDDLNLDNTVLEIDDLVKTIKSIRNI